jgi:hypothetical protein
VFTEDLAAFLDQDEHAVAGVYNGATAVSVLFDAAYADPLNIAGTRPIARGLASVFPEGTSGCIGKTLVIAGVTYTIRGRQPVDDGAFVDLQLEAP